MTFVDPFKRVGLLNPDPLWQGENPLVKLGKQLQAMIYASPPPALQQAQQAQQTVSQAVGPSGGSQGPLTASQYTTSGGALSLSQLIDAAKAAGFTGDSLRTAVAVALGESSGNPQSHNTNAGTGDNSYGLWQINMLGKLGPERLKQYGLSSNDELLNPATNARVAYQMSGGGKNWSPWSAYTHNRYQQYLPSVDAALAHPGTQQLATRLAGLTAADSVPVPRTSPGAVQITTGRPKWESDFSTSNRLGGEPT